MTKECHRTLPFSYWKVPGLWVFHTPSRGIPVLHQQSLPSVNASITKFERLKYQKTISSVSATPTRHLPSMVVNYEALDFAV
jgi:hypothetical protein